ncbi:MAG: PLP-dependent transferase [Bryobacterales bacterium]|nr:PLP-dependent transferase [Bryobacterales bacterium]
MSTRVSRRRALQAAATLPALAGCTATAPPAPVRDFLKELGVRPVINASGAYTMFTASLMRPEAVAAIQAMSTRFVRLDELHDAIGQRIASLLGAPAAMVPSGAAAGLLCGTAGVLTGKDPEKILRLPDLTGMKTEVVVQKSHRFPYDHLVRATGVKLVEVETREEVEKAIGPKTAMLLFLNKSDPLGQVRMEEFVQIGRKHGLPTFNDAAADVPPIENLLKPIRMGFDLVCVSGGKGIRGPQSAGILVGRPDLIAAARLNTSPHSDTIGRSCKVNKEEMVAMLVALESFLREDHHALYRKWEQWVETIQTPVAKVRGVKTALYVPEIANAVPHLRVSWDTSIQLTPAEAQQKLRDGEPSIELVPRPQFEGLEIASWMLQEGEAEIVGRRVAEVLGV